MMTGELDVRSQVTTSDAVASPLQRSAAEAESARGLGYEKLRITTHPQNVAARSMARKLGAHLHFEDGDTVGQITLPPLQGVSAPTGAFLGWGT